jgi:hypothetical protein
MVDEIGTSCTVSIPTRVTDAWGNLVSISYATSTETIWVRPLNEILEVSGIGQLNKEDIRFVAKYTTALVVEAKITYNEVNYIVLAIDKPNESGNIVQIVGYAKKEVT